MDVDVCVYIPLWKWPFYSHSYLPFIVPSLAWFSFFYGHGSNINKVGMGGWFKPEEKFERVKFGPIYAEIFGSIFEFRGEKRPIRIFGIKLTKNPGWNLWSFPAEIWPYFVPNFLQKNIMESDSCRKLHNYSHAVLQNKTGTSFVQDYVHTKKYVEYASSFYQLLQNSTQRFLPSNPTWRTDVTCGRTII